MAHKFSACPRCKHQRCVCTSVPISRHTLGDIFEDYLRMVGNDPDRKIKVREVNRAESLRQTSKPRS